MDRRITGEEVDGGLPVRGITGPLGDRAVPAEAVATVHGAGVRDEKQGAARIFLEEAGSALGVTFMERVGDEAFGFFCFRTRWQNLSEEGIMGIARFHALGEWARDKERKGAACFLCIDSDLLWEVKHLHEFVRVAYGVGEYLLPSRQRRRGNLA